MMESVMHGDKETTDMTRQGTRWMEYAACGLLLMAVGFTLFFTAIVILRLRAEILARRLRVLRFAQGAAVPA